MATKYYVDKLGGIQSQALLSDADVAEQDGPYTWKAAQTASKAIRAAHAVSASSPAGGRWNTSRGVGDEPAAEDAYSSSQPASPRPSGAGPAVRRRYGPGRRMTYGLLWAFWTVLFGIGSITGIASGAVLPGLLGLVITALAAWYDYRIWTYQAKRLLFLIIF